MKKIIAALISLTLFYSSTVCIFAIENQECPYYEEIKVLKGEKIC